MSKRSREKRVTNGLYTDKLIFCERLSNLLVQKKKHDERFKQANFAELIGIDTSTLTKYLSPTNPNMPEMDILLSMCDLLECDVDFLIGRIDNSTHDIAICCEITGLTEECIKKIIYLQNKAKNSFQYFRKPYIENIVTLNELIISEEFEPLLDTISRVKNVNPNVDSWDVAGVKEIEVLTFMATHTLTSFIEKYCQQNKHINKREGE